MRPLREKIVSEKQIRNKTAFALLFFLLFIVACIVFWKWLHQQPVNNGALSPLRSVLHTNEKLFTNSFNNQSLTKTYTVDKAAKKVRVNGSYGMSRNFDTAHWKLQLVLQSGDTMHITLDEIKALPKTEIIFDFKCIEGWSQITHWGGVKFSDFVKKYGLENETKLGYTGLYTPDQQYYVGIDSKSILHPQTILCYEMNGQPLPMNQGYPLRLIIPVKYGVKHLKRIGTIFFSSQRPPDYWYERGYDYYCGL